MSSSDTGASAGEKPKTAPKPGALVGSGSGLKEGFFGIACGLGYGLTSPLVGHPLDTVKTLMQADARYEKKSMVQTLVHVFRTSGFRGLYRGLLPPLGGSLVFRSVQFGAYGAALGSLSPYEWANKEIPFTSGLMVKVPISAVFGSFVRAVIETPLEFVKVRRQTEQSWRDGNSLVSLGTVRNLYTGFNITFVRTTALMGTFFIINDYAYRWYPDLMSQPNLGPFLRGGVAATVAWWVCWPFEVIKNQIQAHSHNPAGGQKDTIMRRLSDVWQREGIKGFTRGIVPGSVRAMIANGMSMWVFNACQTLRHKWE